MPKIKFTKSQIKQFKAMVRRAEGERDDEEDQDNLEVPMNLAFDALEFIEEILDGQQPYSWKDEEAAETATLEARLRDLHKDLDQHYDGQFFWTRCACGWEFPGKDPDQADAYQAAHKDDDIEQSAVADIPRPRRWKE